MGTIVMYPSPGIGHLVSMVEPAKLILNHHPSFCITVLITTPPLNTGSTAPYIASVSVTTPAITFHQLPTAVLPHDPATYPSGEAIMSDFIQATNHHVNTTLCSISVTATISAFILDFFCTPALSIATELAIPSYYFYTSGASALAMFLYAPVIHQNTSGNLKDVDITFDIPGTPSIHSSELLQPMQIRESVEYSFFLNNCIHLPKADGIIVNTFESMEPRAVKTISDGLCVPDNPTPPIFCIGPLVSTAAKAESECLTWLDLQPSRSVVFLCFGSQGLFSKEQLTEIAVGLQRSAQRFLWVVRSPPEPDFDLLLPDGFLDRTKERGLVVKSWAPQVEVLSHDSVGGFVTHCGWNSVLEALCAGVPMVAWPLYAEQKFNRVVLVEEMKVALSMKTESKDGFVSRVEVEKRVRGLMDSEEGEAVRVRTLKIRVGAKAALSGGGSSLMALSKLIDAWKLC